MDFYLLSVLHSNIHLNKEHFYFFSIICRNIQGVPKTYDLEEDFETEILGRMKCPLTKAVSKSFKKI